AGTSVKWSQAQEAMALFLDKTNIPAFVNGMGRGTLPRDSRHLFNRTRRTAMQDCDLIILAGAVLDFRLAFGESIPKNARIIQLEMDNTLVGQNRPADVALVGNLACTFEALSRVMETEQIVVDFSSYAALLREEEDVK